MHLALFTIHCDIMCTLRNDFVTHL